MDMKDFIVDEKRRKRHGALFVPVGFVWMLIVLSASCLIYPSFNSNVFLVELIIWPNTQICCQPYELLLILPFPASLFTPTVNPPSNVGQSSKTQRRAE